jgi:hypothetical protein
VRVEVVGAKILVANMVVQDEPGGDEDVVDDARRKSPELLGEIPNLGVATVPDQSVFMAVFSVGFGAPRHEPWELVTTRASASA